MVSVKEARHSLASKSTIVQDDTREIPTVDPTWMDITDVLTPEGRKLIRTGEILFFSKVTLKITRKASNGKVWAKRVLTFSPEEVDVSDNVK